SSYERAEWTSLRAGQGCALVMEALEGAEQISGTPALTEAWRRAVLAHPLAYLQHRAAVTATFLLGDNLTMWTFDIAQPGRTVFADNPWFMALKAVHDALKPTPLFRAGPWPALS